MTDPSGPRISIFRHGAVLLLYIAAVLAATYPVITEMGESVATYPTLYLTHRGDSLPDAGETHLGWDMDIGIAVWVYSWNIHQLFHDPLNLFQANIYHPYRNTLAMIDNYLGLAIMGIPFQLLFHRPALTYNMILLAAFALTAWAVYGYLLHKTRDAWAAGLAGWITALLPYHYAHVHTIHKSMFFSYPLGMWMMERFLETRRLRYAILLGGIAFYQVISTWYLAAGLAVILGAYGVFLALSSPARVFRRDTLPAVILFLVLTIPAVAVFARPYLAVKREFPQFERDIDRQPILPPKAYLTVADNNILYGHLFPELLPVRQPLKAYFPGFLLYILGSAGAALYVASPRIRRMDRFHTGWFLLGFGILGFVFSLGPYLRVGGARIPLPFQLLFYGVPVFRGLRGPQDFAIPFYLSLLVFSGLTLAVLHRRIRPGLHRIVVLLLGIAIAAESLRMPFRLARLPHGASIPQCYRWAGQQEPRPVVTTLYPSQGFPGIQYQRLRHESMYYSIFHFCPMPEGHGAYIPPLALILGSRELTFPRRDAVSFIRALGVEYLLLDLHDAPEEVRHAVMTDLTDVPGIHLHRSFPASLVYRVDPPTPDPAPQLVAGILLEEESPPELYIHNPGSMKLFPYPVDQHIRIGIRPPRGNGTEISYDVPPYMPAGATRSMEVSFGLNEIPAGELRERVTVESGMPLEFYLADRREKGLTGEMEIIRLAPL